MTWKPKYTIQNHLLRTIREIGEALGVIKTQQLGQPALAKLIKEARTLSTFASTSIEGNPLPLTDVKRLIKQAPAQVRDTEREILNYNRGLEWIHTQLSLGEFDISTKSFETIQGIVTEGLLDNPADIGKVRKKPVIIRDPRAVDKVVFMPPDHEDVPNLLKSLMAFINENIDELDPILLAGIFHKQAVIVHPFMDGNGRSTRLMTMAILGMAGFDIFNIFSFEAYYNQNVTRYFQKVGEQGDYYDLQDNIDYTDWLEYFAEGILDELKRVTKTLQIHQLRLEPHHKIVMDYIDKRGSITQREYGEISERSLAARKQDFSKLVELNLIENKGIGRSSYYVRVN